MLIQGPPRAVPLRPSCRVTRAACAAGRAAAAEAPHRRSCIIFTLPPGLRTLLRGLICFSVSLPNALPWYLCATPMPNTPLLRLLCQKVPAPEDEVAPCNPPKNNNDDRIRIMVHPRQGLALQAQGYQPDPSSMPAPLASRPPTQVTAPTRR